MPGPPHVRGRRAATARRASVKAAPRSSGASWLIEYGATIALNWTSAVGSSSSHPEGTRPSRTCADRRVRTPALPASTMPALNSAPHRTGAMTRPSRRYMTGTAAEVGDRSSRRSLIEERGEERLTPEDAGDRRRRAPGASTVTAWTSWCHCHAATGSRAMPISPGSRTVRSPLHRPSSRRARPRHTTAWSAEAVEGGRRQSKYDSSVPRRRTSRVAQWKEPPNGA